MIVKGPENYTVPTGAVVIFHCLAQGERAIWKINNTAIFDQGDIIDFNGFTYSAGFDGGSSTHNLTMTVNANPEYNNTRIMCLVYPPDYYYNFPGNLTVIGILDEDKACVLISHLFNYS